MISRTGTSGFAFPTSVSFAKFARRYIAREGELMKERPCPHKTYFKPFLNTPYKEYRDDKYHLGNMCTVSE